MEDVRDVGKEVACFEEYIVPYLSSKSIAKLPRPGSNGIGSFVSQESSRNVDISKQKVLPNSTENCSHCSVGFISKSSLRKSAPFILNPPNGGRVDLTMKTVKHENLDFNSICQENSKTSENEITPNGFVDRDKFSEILIESEALTDGMLERERKRCSSVMNFSPQPYPESRDCNKPGKVEWTVMEGSKEEGSENLDKKREMPGSLKEGGVQGSHLTPDDVVRVIGQEPFQKARQTIIEQQKLFSGQILELHRLIKVQRSMARSPEKLPEKNCHANKPPIQMDNIFYMNPLDRLKIDDLKCSAEKVYFPPKLPTTPIIIPSASAKLLPPYIFHPPNETQWLVPIKSASEGLFYKPFLGPRFTTNFTYGNEVGQGYIRRCAMPPVNNASAENVLFKEEPVEKDGFALFPMTPSSKASKDENDGQNSRVVKVVPHNRKSALGSAARIVESLQEERRVLRLSSCT